MLKMQWDKEMDITMTATHWGLSFLEELEDSAVVVVVVVAEVEEGVAEVDVEVLHHADQKIEFLFQVQHFVINFSQTQWARGSGMDF